MASEILLNLCIRITTDMYQFILDTQAPRFALSARVPTIVINVDRAVEIALHFVILRFQLVEDPCVIVIVHCGRVCQYLRLAKRTTLHPRLTNDGWCK